MCEGDIAQGTNILKGTEAKWSIWGMTSRSRSPEHSVQGRTAWATPLACKSKGLLQSSWFSPPSHGKFSRGTRGRGGVCQDHQQVVETECGLCPPPTASFGNSHLPQAPQSPLATNLPMLQVLNCAENWHQFGKSYSTQPL